MFDLICLFTTIGILMGSMRRLEIYEVQKETFRKEKCSLITILVIFALSYSVRLGFDLMESIQGGYNSFYQILLAVIFPLIYDSLPVCCILYIHRQSFKVIKVSPLMESTEGLVSEIETTIIKFTDKSFFSTERNSTVQRETEKSTATDKNKI